MLATGHPKLQGYGGDIWTSLHEVLNFDYELTETEDGTFNRMIDMLVENKILLWHLLMSLTEKRANLVDHSISLQTVRNL